MRSFIFLFCVLTFGFTPKDGLSQNAKIKIDFDKSISIDEVFDIIQDQTDYKFLYSLDLFENAPKVDLKKGTIRAYKLLEDCLSQTVFTYDFTDDQTIILKRKPSFVGTDLVELPQQTITGKVSDINGDPLPGVNVLVGAAGSNVVRGVATDFDGNYSIQTAVGEVLRFSYVGYVTQSFVIDAQTEINVVLLQDTSELNEVVVVGYGTTAKKDLTGSVGSVRAEAIEQIETQTIDKALVGKITGVYVTAQNGGPGEGAIVNIRGMSALTGDNQPLYVVDGIPIVVKHIYASGTVEQNQLVDAQPNPLLSINPNDIERVDVLKDASAASIYGSRAANGVVMITTKRGKRNQATRFNFSYSGTIQNAINTIDMLNADEYKAFHTEQAQITLDNSPYPEVWWPFIYPGELQIVNDPNSYFGNGDTDWQEEILKDNALWNQYNFSLSGGTDKINYMVSSTVTDQEGVLIGTKFKRYGFSTSLDADITKKIKIGTTVNYNHSVNKRSGISNLGYPANFRPDIPIFNEDGSPTTDPASVWGQRNPVEGDGKIRDKNTSKNLLGNLFVEYQLLDDLKFRSELSISSSENRGNKFSPGYTQDGAGNVGRYGLEDGDHILYISNNFGSSTSFSNTLNYTKTINNDHSINALVGVSWDRSRIEIQGQRYAGFPDTEILTDINSAREQFAKTSTLNKNALNSAFARINYNYKDRYLATFTGRRDGSIKFGPDNRFGFFPSGALGWNIHNESFMEDNELISQLKFRASYGITGNDNLVAFSFVPVYKSYANYFEETSLYDGINGIAVAGVPNPAIKWEETQQLDIGLDFGLFNGRLNGELAYFEKNTYDIILFTPVAAQNGATNYSSNAADLSNKGWEFMLNGDIVRKDDFRWNSSFNISTNKNNIEKLNGGTLFGRGGYLFEGMSPGVIRGFDVVSIAQTQAEIDALNTAAGGAYQEALLAPGDYIYKDQNGDNVINDDDVVELGDINPDFFGGWNNSLTYKNFDFSFNFQFANGNKKIFGPVAGNGGLDLARPNQNKPRFVLDTWSADNTDATYARFGSRTHGSPFSGNNSKSVLDASYIRLRSAAISYNLPTEWLNGTSINNAKITLSGNNLFTITDYPGLDPEGVNLQRAGFLFDRQYDSNSAYPITRTFSLAVNISF